MIPYVSVWSRMVHYDPVQPIMAWYGPVLPVWPRMAQYGPIALCGPILPRMALYDSVLTCMARIILYAGVDIIVKYIKNIYLNFEKN